MTSDAVPDEVINQFKANLSRIIARRPVKIWIAKRNRHRVDTVASVGLSQPLPIRLFARGAGFYLLGEGVPPDLLEPIHNAFLDFCRKVKDARDKNKLHRVDVRYRSVRATDPYWYNRLIMHYPFSPPQRRIREGEE
jgi:hypothetical protein